jgi:sec-independent protein translocase protein TatB
MEILGIGPSELIFIVILAIIVLGPKDMQKAGRTIGKWLRTVVTSDGWKLFQQTSREIQTLPNRLMRDAALDELKETQRELRRPFAVDEQPQRPSAADPLQDRDAAARPADEPRILPSAPGPDTKTEDSGTHA